MSENDALKFLLDTEAEFGFLEKLEGGCARDGLAVGGDFFSMVAELKRAEDLEKEKYEQSLKSMRGVPGTTMDMPLARNEQRALRFAKLIERSTHKDPPSSVGLLPHPFWPVVQHPYTSKWKPNVLKVATRWPLPWPIHHFVYQAPEGAGKSSIVAELVRLGFKVVFCCKSNDQVVEQQAGFHKRWPLLRTQRYISRARNLQEQLSRIGVQFKPVYYQSGAPYATGAVDEPSTRQALRAALDAAGHVDVDHHTVFDRLFTGHRADTINGLELDVIMVTIAAFQAFCTARHRPWWHALGLRSGKKQIFRHKEHIDWGHHVEMPRVVDLHTVVPKTDEQGFPQRTMELGLEKIIVVIDDPDRTDFDVRRLIEDEHVAEVYRKRRALPKYQEQWVYPDHWKKMGYPPRLAQALAEEWTQKAHEHQLEQFQERQFEARPDAKYIGYGLRRGYARNSPLAPKILVTTTENITTRLAHRSLSKVNRWNREMSPRWEHMLSEFMEFKPNTNCHVTLLTTRMVRKGEHVLLLLIAAQLQQEFPEQDLAFIADGLGCELNLMNNRGRNDLADRSTLIKLSVPNPTVAINLWAQFPTSEKPAVLNTILLADLANQAIGRNQGFRFAGRQCMVLVDPMYARALVSSGLLRYHCTPWSFHKPPGPVFKMHSEQTAMECRLAELLGGARNFGMSLAGMRLGFALPERQCEMYCDWLDRNNVVYQHHLKS